MLVTQLLFAHANIDAAFFDVDLTRLERRLFGGGLFGMLARLANRVRRPCCNARHPHQKDYRSNTIHALRHPIGS